MRPIAILSLVAGIGLTAAPAALAQPAGVCRPEMLRGVYSVTCTGFTRLANIQPGADPTILVPFAGTGRAVYTRDGTGTSTGLFTIAGTAFPVVTQDKFTVKPDCTGDKTYTLQALGQQFPGKASVVYMPFGVEFNILLQNDGDVVSCQYKRISLID